MADPRFDGVFDVGSVVIAGQEVDLATPPRVTIETRFGGLTVEPGCNIFFGSFSLAEDGAASFTIAGGSSEACDRFEVQEEAVLAALRGATSWREESQGFRFDGEGTSISIVR